MEQLPGDVLLTIVQRLAVQNPPSLLRAAYSCKTILRLIEYNASVWSAAFLAGIFMNPGGSLFETDAILRARLDAVISALGGFRQLVVARCSKRRDCHEPEQKQGRQGCGSCHKRPDPGGVSKGGNIITFLAVIPMREGVEGTLILWGCSERHIRYEPVSGFLVTDKGIIELETVKAKLLRSAPPFEEFKTLEDYHSRCLRAGGPQKSVEIFEWEAEGREKPCWPLRMWSARGEVCILKVIRDGKERVVFEGGLKLSFQSATDDHYMFSGDYSSLMLLI